MSTETIQDILPEDLPRTVTDSDDKCPWCGERQEDLYDVSDDTTCDSCGRPFTVKTIVTYELQAAQVVKCPCCDGGTRPDGAHCRAGCYRGETIEPLPYSAATTPKCPACKGDGRLTDPKFTFTRIPLFGSTCLACGGSGRAVPIRKVGDAAEEEVEQAA